MPLKTRSGFDIPYYLLLVGDPETIPYSFQYQLDVEYAVGRLWFEKDGKPDLNAFARYAQSVVEAEKDGFSLPHRACFLGVQNEDDTATNLSAEHLVRPLADRPAKERASQWDIKAALKDLVRKADLASLLNGAEAPAVLFTASHGMGFPDGDTRQLSHQGALLCQDWPGPMNWRGKPIPPEYYTSSEDDLEACLRTGTGMNELRATSRSEPGQGGSSEPAMRNLTS
jgi:hypothetical protein